MLPGRALRLGSRTSPMALAQARQVSELLGRRVPGLEVEIVGIETSGDRWRGDLSELGGKGAFLKELDRSLLRSEIDAAVHCLKDVPGDVPLPEGTSLAAYLPREDVHDVVVFPPGSPYGSLAELPDGATIGTSSVRRTAQLLRHRPGLRVEPCRGNVNTRLARLDADGPDALIVARAGLRRVGLTARIGEVLPLDVMCPAVGAGVLALQCRDDTPGVADLLRLVDDPPTRTHVQAERAMLHALHGHCNSPIAGHCATAPEGRLHLTGLVFTPDGTELAHAHAYGTDPQALGTHVADTLIERGARRIIAGIPH